jgi:hypothetical protein
MTPHQLHRRREALKPFMAAPNIPDGRVILFRPPDQPYDKESPGTWTDTPAMTAGALWRRVEWIWRQERDLMPSELAVVENALDHLETIERWTREQRV